LGNWNGFIQTCVQLETSGQIERVSFRFAYTVLWIFEQIATAQIKIGPTETTSNLGRVRNI